MAPEKPSKKAQPPKLNNEVLFLPCEWGNCEYCTDNMDAFASHVGQHGGDIEITVIETDPDARQFNCSWKECSFNTQQQQEILRHLYFHAFHTKIKCLGSNLVARLQIQGCLLEPTTRNGLPPLPEPFLCLWAKCSCEFLNVQAFFNHASSHANSATKDGKNKFPCLWEGCSASTASCYKLKDHLRSHTQEKHVACPVCGGMFNSRTKFTDHCVRQCQIEDMKHTCETCGKSFASERFLRDHTRLHDVFHFCELCPERRFRTKFELTSHNAYKHSKERLYPCEHCPYVGKTHNDLRRHAEKHVSSIWFCCEAEGCDFSAKTMITLNDHIKRVHEGVTQPLYECHICQQKFRHRVSLTRHATKRHDLKPALGSTAFKFREDEEGIFRIINGRPPSSTTDAK